MRYICRMLSSLLIKNYAIIENVEISFSPNQTIITGETGAGKSILLGALGILMGERADTKVLMDTTRKCIVEGQFNISAYKMHSFFDDHELDYDECCIVRREITPQGKSRAYINDSPVSVKTLKLLGEQLIDIHEQFDNAELQTKVFRFMVLDSLAGNTSHLKHYQVQFKKYKSEEKELATLEQALAECMKEDDYNQYLLNEIAELAPKEHEDETLEQEVQLLGQADAMMLAFKGNSERMNDGEWNIRELLQNVLTELRPFQHLIPELEKLYLRLESVMIEVDDIHQELTNLAENLETDPEKLQEAEQRLNQLNKLLTKHRVMSANDLLAIQKDLSDKTYNIQQLEEKIAHKQVQLNALHNNLENLANELSVNRHNHAGELEQHVVAMLADLGMPHVTFQVAIESNENLTDTGKDEIQFLFSANLGIPLKPVAQVASGGERSRLMFTIKSLVAQSIHLPTMIFDEIDAGISGAIALRMSYWLRKLSRNHQVICITHSPQIASSADLHYRISKETGNGKTFTVLLKLNEEEKISELAKMLSGDPPSTGAIKNAGELLVMNRQ